MRIAFLQKYPFPYFGVMSLSACLPEDYEREVFIGDLEDNVVSEVIRYRPSVVAVPIMSLEYRWVLETVGRIKSELPETVVIAGYIHATSCPEIIEREEIDAVCIGEGEYSFPLFLSKLQETGRLEEVNGFWIKRRGKIIKSTEPSLVLDLNKLPDEDRSIYYDKYRSLKEEQLKHFMASRGCPFSCSFCCHQVYRNLYRGRGKYVRRKSPEKIIGEIQSVKDKYGISSVCFLDDVFVMEIQWLKKFAFLYREKIGLPYFCAVTPADMTEEIARLLKESGCHTINFGVETADEEKRFKILNKRITNQQIRNCARLIKKYGMKLQTTVMFGLPFETVEKAFDNIRFNIEIGTDFMGSNILLPFPRTGIEKMALEMGILDKDYLYSEEYRGIHLNSVFKFKDIEVIENIQKISHLALRFPFLLPLFKKLVKIRSKNLFFGIYILAAMWRYKSEKPIAWPEVIKVFWRARVNYLRYLN